MARGLNFGYRKGRDCTIYAAKTKEPISCAVTSPLFLHMQKVGFLMTRLSNSNKTISLHEKAILLTFARVCKYVISILAI